MNDSDELETFGHVIRALNMGYLCLLEPNAKDAGRACECRQVAAAFRPLISVPVIVNTGFDKAKANGVIGHGAIHRQP